MLTCRRTTLCHPGFIPTTILVIAIICATPAAVPAYAQSHAELNGRLVLFGERWVPSAPSNTPPTDIVPMTATPPLTITITPHPSSAGSAMAVAYCVRLCDGRYFPLPLLTGSSHTTPIALCKALCPASKTRIYVGINIDRAFAANGVRYSALSTAFRFRKELITDCTCNGRGFLGTATIVIEADPTLRAGDIVATRQGLQVFTGTARVTHHARDFSPIEKFRRLTASLRTKVRW